MWLQKEKCKSLSLVNYNDDDKNNDGSRMEVSKQQKQHKNKLVLAI